MHKHLRFFLIWAVIAAGALPALLSGEPNPATTPSPATTAPSATAWRTETAEQRAARLLWWHQAKFGMFIHWGTYCVPAGEWKGQQIPGLGEWIQHKAKIPVAEYEKFAAQFNPTKFDADEIVRIARDAGMKYIVITAKHHEGFAMYGSKASPYNIVDATPYRHDPLKDLAAACAKNGMRLGFYYSQSQDWHEPGASGNAWDFKFSEDAYDHYLREKVEPQLRELLTQYGPVAVVWFDTPQHMTPERADRLRAIVKELAPDAIINNRAGPGGGDYGTPEQRIPKIGQAGDWETCMTLNDTWGFKKSDHNWKSAKTLVQNLVDIASKGGNYLLNVGPTSEGLIPDESIARLAEIGKWMKANGDSIYGTTPSALPPQDWGRVTANAGKTFLHVFTPPGDEIPVKGFVGTPKAVWLLKDVDRTPLKTRTTADGLLITLPAASVDPIDTVIVVENSTD